METKQFESGKTYYCRSICDYECITKITIAKRTAKTITTTEGKTLRISIYEGVEQVKPDGSYSMASIIGADREFDAAKFARKGTVKVSDADVVRGFAIPSPPSHP